MHDAFPKDVGPRLPYIVKPRRVVTGEEKVPTQHHSGTVLGLTADRAGTLSHAVARHSPLGSAVEQSLTPDHAARVRELEEQNRALVAEIEALKATIATEQVPSDDDALKAKTPSGGDAGAIEGVRTTAVDSSPKPSMGRVKGK